MAFERVSLGEARRKATIVETQIPATLFWIAGIAATAFSIGCNSAIIGWNPTLTRSPIGSAALARLSAATAKPDFARARAAHPGANTGEVASNKPVVRAVCVEEEAGRATRSTLRTRHRGG